MSETDEFELNAPLAVSSAILAFKSLRHEGAKQVLDNYFAFELEKQRMEQGFETWASYRRERDEAVKRAELAEAALAAAKANGESAAALQDEVERLRKQNASLGNMGFTAESKWSDQLREANGKITRLKAELAEAREERDHAREDRDRLQAELQAAKPKPRKAMKWSYAADGIYLVAERCRNVAVYKIGYGRWASRIDGKHEAHEFLTDAIRLCEEYAAQVEKSQADVTKFQADIAELAS